MIPAVDLAYTPPHLPSRIHKRRPATSVFSSSSELYRTLAHPTTTAEILMSKSSNVSARVVRAGSGSSSDNSQRNRLEYPSPPPEDEPTPTDQPLPEDRSIGVGTAVEENPGGTSGVRRRPSIAGRTAGSGRGTLRPSRRPKSLDGKMDEEAIVERRQTFRFQGYLSQALAYPGLGAFDESAPGAPAAPDVYGTPPHNPSHTAEIAMERVLNYFMLPPKLEVAIVFGVLACLDSWLYIFTILPLRFGKALMVIGKYWKGCVWDYFNYEGRKLKKKGTGEAAQKKRRERVSGLSPSHKADLLRGTVLLVTCIVLMWFDASKMYHNIRGQSGIKLYVIYNMLDFADKLCAAYGQDVSEVIFSREVLEYRFTGRSKIWRPIAFFSLALTYNIAHSLCLFYQVITLNVAVNSYSNALVTLLLSVQFVEIKSTVFKRFEKENLFQLLLADVVERFQLSMMLFIIVCRNLVEIGIWSLAPSSYSGGGILPKSFTIFPSWMGRIMGPFVMVMGSETIVDWLKHSFIAKFNNVRPILYERFLDVQCSDYHARAFADQNLTRRLGLPVIPLACLFIRSSMQTWHMFLATSPTAHMPQSLMGVTNMVLFLMAVFLVFLAVKLCLGVLLLGWAEKRVEEGRKRKRMYANSGAKRSSTFGTIMIEEEARRTIYEGMEQEMREVEGRERKGRERDMDTSMKGLDPVERYVMCAKRIW